MRELVLPIERIKNLYVDKSMSARQIAAEFGVDKKTIVNRLHGANIEVRADQPKRKIGGGSRKLIKLYWNDDLSLEEIAKIYNVSSGTVRNALKRDGVPIKTISRGLMKAKRSFDLSLLPEVEKAYIAGFFDGEGSISCFLDSKNYARVRISFANTDAGVMLYLANLLNKSLDCLISEYWKPLYSIQIRRAADQFEFLTVIIPYLKIKKAIAEEALSILNEKLAIPQEWQ